MANTTTNLPEPTVAVDLNRADILLDEALAKLGLACGDAVSARPHGQTRQRESAQKIAKN